MARILGGMTLYDEVGGFDVLLAVCRRWNALCLADPVAAHPFSHGTLHPQHDERLAAYLAEALGGPLLYTGGYGDESTMQRMHAGNGEHQDLDEVCVRLFRRALDDVGGASPPAGVTPAPDVRALHEFLENRFNGRRAEA